jgi:hypothetical protein
MASANFPQKGAHVRRKADGMIGEVYASDPSKDVLTVRWRTATGFLTQVCTSENFARDWELTGLILTTATSKSYSFKLLFILIGGFIVLIFFIHQCDYNFVTGKTRAPAVSHPTVEELSDSKYLEARYGAEAESRCEDGADDYLRSIAKWDFAWDSGDKFSSHFVQIQSSGVLVMISRKAKLQNGFGAYKHIALTCDYDTQAKKVVGYHIEQ